MLVKTEEKAAFSISASSMSCVTRVPAPFSSGDMFHTLPIASYVLTEAHLAVFEVFTRFNSSQALAFLTATPHARTVSLYSSWVTHPCFHLLYAYFLCLSFARSYVLIHAGLLPFLPDFLLTGIHSFRSWKRQSFK